MKLSIDRKVLLTVLQAMRFAEKTNVNPVCNSARMQVEGSAVRITATNFTVTVEALIPATLAAMAGADGEVCVPLRSLREIVAVLPGETVTLSRHGDKLAVNAGSARFSLAVIGVEDFPTVPENTEEMWKITPGEMQHLIDMVRTAASTDQTRGHICGAMMELSGEEFTAAATDGHRLAVGQLPIVNDAGMAFKTMVPTAVLTELRQLSALCTGDLQLNAQDERLFARGTLEVGGTVWFSGSVVDGDKFPPYQQILPKAMRHVLDVEREAMLETVKRLMVMSGKLAMGIVFQETEGNLTLSVMNTEVGEGRETINCAVAEEFEPIGINGRYLIDMLSTISGTRVRIEFESPLSPMLFCGEHDTFRGVIMPMRV